MFHDLLKRWGEIAVRFPGRAALAFDVVYGVARYVRTFGRLPNLISPRTYNEYLNRKKLFDRRPLLSQLADKYQVRQYVRERVGDEYLTRLYLVTDDPDEIDFTSLPPQFVIKATHGSSWTVIVSDKAKVDDQEVKAKCARWLGQNYYDLKREWCYRDIEPRIVVEEYLGSACGVVPCDYKFFCFEGMSRFVQVDVGRFETHTRDFYDRDWQRLDVRLIYENCPEALPPPENLNEMLQVAEALAAGLDFVRVDLYNVNGHVYFGEMTHYPGRGFCKLEPREWDWVFGAYWGGQRRADAVSQG